MNNFQKAFGDWVEVLTCKPLWCTLMFIVAGIIACLILTALAIFLIVSMEFVGNILGLSGFFFFLYAILYYLIFFFLMTLFVYFIEPYVKRAKENKYVIAFSKWFKMVGDE